MFGKIILKTTYWKKKTNIKQLKRKVSKIPKGSHYRFSTELSDPIKEKNKDSFSQRTRKSIKLQQKQYVKTQEGKGYQCNLRTKQLAVTEVTLIRYYGRT